MTDRLSETDWQQLLRRIANGKCTPFLGAGACAGAIPPASEIAGEWAKDYGYPLSDSSDLARVAQFIAINEEDDIIPKENIAMRCADASAPDFSAPNEIHGILADLPLPIYITTNYDDFMFQALRSRGKKPAQELCRWNGYVKQYCASVFEQGFEPSSATPLVYHLHGSKDTPQSLVLTEDDYLDFLVQMSRDPIHLLPSSIQMALAATSLLFVGYGRMDWNFRVLFRMLINSLDANLAMKSVAVQLSPVAKEASEDERRRVHTYLDRYFPKIQKIPIRIYWGDVNEFATELRERWGRFLHG